MKKNPFKKITTTANATQKKWERNETSEANSRNCESCGAARPKDTNLTTCDYCGFRFMTIDEKIKTDK